MTIILEDIFIYFKDLIGKNVLTEKLSISKGVSHGKVSFCRIDTNHGKLRFEKMHFCQNIPTVLHTHPEFIIDEIILGSLSEECFRKNGNGLYSYQESHNRQVGDRQKVYDPFGHPHKVIAKNEDCLTACLYLGHEDVKEIFSTHPHSINNTSH